MSKPCYFCDHPGENVFSNSTQFEARWDAYPLTKGHALIMPKRHVVSFFDLTIVEKGEAFDLAHGTCEYINVLHKPSGYNICINEGEAAGRTIHHLHIHVIPRYPGDVPDPRGGIRNILPGPSPDLWTNHD